MKKLILAALAVILIGLAGWLGLAGKKPPPASAWVSLPDGTSLRILAVTYGTNHVVGSKFAQVTAKLPSALQNMLTSLLGARATPAQTVTTPTPEMLVWVDRQTNHPAATIPMNGYFTAVLGDGNGFISGPDTYMNTFSPWSQVEALHFSAFPRRAQKMSLNLFYHDAKGVGHTCGSLSFENPIFRTYPQWPAEPLPDIKRVGDLEVTLRGLETGHDNNQTWVRKNGRFSAVFGTNRNDGRNGTSLDLDFRPLGNTNESWQVAGVELSDVTSNSVHNSSTIGTGGNGSGFAFEPGLWPDEAAWKIKLELKRSEGFRPEELFMFKNVPLGAQNQTNYIGWTTNVAGVSVTLQSIVRRTPQTNNSWNSLSFSKVHFVLSPLPGGMELDLLRMVFDTGKTNQIESWSSGGGQREYDFREIPLAATNANFIFAIQQSRTVEFTVKPELPKAKAEVGSGEKR